MTAVSPGSSQQAVVEAALVLLERMGLSPADLAAVPQSRTPVPTFAAYVPVVSAAVSDGTRRAFQTRPLDAYLYTFVAADALVLKVHEAGRVVNVPALLAAEINLEEHREILGLQVTSAETAPDG